MIKWWALTFKDWLLAWNTALLKWCIYSAVLLILWAAKECRDGAPVPPPPWEAWHIAYAFFYSLFMLQWKGWNHHMNSSFISGDTISVQLFSSAAPGLDAEVVNSNWEGSLTQSFKMNEPCSNEVYVYI